MFYLAAENGNAEELQEILRNNPNLDVNWRNENENGSTALKIACQNGHDSIVSILLAHLDIDVNLKDLDGWTPFSSACWYGYTSCARLLLKDHRVKVNEPDKNGDTPLKWAAYFGHHDVIKWWIASGREMNLGTPTKYGTDGIAAATREGKTEVASLHERFKSDATKTRSEVRLELGINGSLPFSLFLFSFSM